MGWYSDEAPEHEGYIVGVVPATNVDGSTSTWRFRELHQSSGDGEPMRVRHIQAACSCGWRSERINVFGGADYVPTFVEAPPYIERQMVDEWHHHVDHVARRKNVGAFVG